MIRHFGTPPNSATSELRRRAEARWRELRASARRRSSAEFGGVPKWRSAGVPKWSRVKSGSRSEVADLCRRSTHLLPKLDTAVVRRARKEAAETSRRKTVRKVRGTDLWTRTRRSGRIRKQCEDISLLWGSNIRKNRVVGGRMCRSVEGRGGGDNASSPAEFACNIAMTRPYCMAVRSCQGCCMRLARLALHLHHTAKRLALLPRRQSRQEW